MDQWLIFSGTQVQRTNLPDPKTLYSWRKGKNANPISKTDDYMKHIFWKHNQEGEHWANLPAEGQRKIVVDRYSNSETWKAMKFFWDASAKENGKKRGVA